ncbi:hypothetical protein ABIC16_004251 [Sphingomonas sp. PvP055]|uniref:hypothetical protein n=1 Tax=Sphingomonas sp. PvP055 TaxID=3156391 RepID=UPI0033967495
MPLYINYRDLSVQQLCSIYERLLKHELTVEDGTLSVSPNAFACNNSGSYYTPNAPIGRSSTRRWNGDCIRPYFL